MGVFKENEPFWDIILEFGTSFLTNILMVYANMHGKSAFLIYSEFTNFMGIYKFWLYIMAEWYTNEKKINMNDHKNLKIEINIILMDSFDWFIIVFFVNCDWMKFVTIMIYISLERKNKCLVNKIIKKKVFYTMILQIIFLFHHFSYNSI